MYAYAAGLRIARLRLPQGGAAATAMSRVARDGARAAAGPTAAILRAAAPAAPAAHSTVDGARLFVARRRVAERRARSAAVGGLDSDRALASLGATTAYRTFYRTFYGRLNRTFYRTVY